jgi:hypothetical protein
MGGVLDRLQATRSGLLSTGHLIGVQVYLPLEMTI